MAVMAIINFGFATVTTITVTTITATTVTATIAITIVTTIAITITIITIVITKNRIEAMKFMGKFRIEMEKQIEPKFTFVTLVSLVVVLFR